MRIAALLLALTAPQPVTSLGAVRSSDGTVTLTWTLPADPSVTRLTVIRDRLDAWEETTFEIGGPATSLDDVTARADESYRYFVYTRNAAGEWSGGVFIEVVNPDDFDDHSWECHAEGSIGAGPSGVPLVLAALALSWAFLPRRR